MASNEELQAANEELISAQEYLQQTFSKLEISETRTRTLITAAPIAIAVLNTRKLIIESANDKMLEIWNKDISVIGSTMHSILSDTANQDVLQSLDKVFISAKAH